jgi:hypothetical protein
VRKRLRGYNAGLQSCHYLTLFISLSFEVGLIFLGQQFVSRLVILSLGSSMESTRSQDAQRMEKLWRIVTDREFFIVEVQDVLFLVQRRFFLILANNYVYLMELLLYMLLAVGREYPQNAP